MCSHGDIFCLGLYGLVGAGILNGFPVVGSFINWSPTCRVSVARERVLLRPRCIALVAERTVADWKSK